jgi:hypothetical protein
MRLGVFDVLVGEGHISLYSLKHFAIQEFLFSFNQAGSGRMGHAVEEKVVNCSYHGIHHRE